jgi:predicted O-methyltransferase YrrM
MLAKLRRARQERRFLASTLARVAPDLVRSLQRPSVAEMLERRREVPDLLDEVCPGWQEYIAEVREVREELERRYQTQAVSFPPEFGIESDTETLLYALVRSCKPKIVLETGVANGHATVVLLTAIRKNGLGELHSTDVSGDVGGLLTAEERAGWRFHRLPPDGSRAAFSALLSELGQVDLFFHDSQHSYMWQSFEYESVLPRLNRTAWLVTDDADASYAFLDFCSRHRLEPITVLDRRKVIGLVWSGLKRA